MFRRRALGTTANRLAVLEDEIRCLRREAAECRAAYDDALDLALIHAVPNAVYRLVMEARVLGWTISYSRQRREQQGVIRFEHPTDLTHNCSIKLPIPDDPAAHRKLEAEIGMRIRRAQAA